MVLTMHQTEGRSTGFPKFYQAVKQNDSPMPIHQAFIDEKEHLASVGKELDEGDKKEDDFGKDFPKDFLKEILSILFERQQFILRLICNDCTLTSQKISEKISEKESITKMTIKKDISILKEMGILTREGGRKDGRRIIIIIKK